jgi:hypothetical protein
MYESYPKYCLCGDGLFYKPLELDRNIVTDKQLMFCFNPQCDHPVQRASKTHNKTDVKF